MSRAGLGSRRSNDEQGGANLLDLLEEIDPGPRDPRLDVVHAVRPNMWGACGWCICGCAGAKGAPFELVKNLPAPKVTCPECRAVMAVEVWP